MTVIEGAALGLLQGIAEFLPISSSGHLAVAKRLFGLGEVPLLFDIILHVATLAAVLVVFRRRIWSLIVSFARWVARRAGAEDAENLRLIVALLAATVLTGVIGIGIESLHPADNLKIVSSGFIATAIILVVAERLGTRRSAKGEGAAPGLRAGIIVGIAQGIGVLPGVSRSGITISGSLLAGLGRERAGEFSFILSIPAVLGAFLLELKDASEMIASVSAAPLIVGFAIAFSSGLVAIRLLLSIVKRARLSWFAAYLVPLGVLGLLFF